MLDISNIPSQQQQTYTFYATGNWQTWSKPRNAKFIEIFCLGGGAGGGYPNVLATGTVGPSGGGSGGIVRGLIPAFLLPDTIYILIGKGGAGSKVSNTSGTNGGISYIALQPSTSEQTLICKSSTAGASGGTPNGSAALAATISVVSLSAFGNLGLFTAIAGVNSSAGGANTGTAGSNTAALATNILTGGTGGGGKTATVFGAGGNITSASAILTTQVNGGVANAQDGDSGYGTLQPFCGTGGAGGAGRSGSTGAGGNGGKGFYGCGGGGAGAGSAVGSSGGDGGDGLVIITVIT